MPRVPVSHLAGRRSLLTALVPFRLMKSMAETRVTLEDVKAANERIKPHISRTQVMTSAHMDELAGRRLFFKCEHLQKTGSFKFRGAWNAIAHLTETGQCRAGVVTHSSGNHGQALARASQAMNVPCSIVVPSGTCRSKTDAIERYGAQLVMCEPTYVSRDETCSRVSKETGKIYVSSCAHPDVIAGQGTMALEFLEQVPSLDAILVPVSGGGLAAGVCTVMKALKPSVRVYLVTPTGKMLGECIKSRERLWPNPPQLLDTVAEGIRVQQLPPLPFSIVCDLAEKDVIELSDEEIVAAMKITYSTMKQVIEGASGAVVAAALKHKFPTDVQNIGIILCGGNIDVDHLPW